MGTTKRERQKANRQQRLEQLAKSARKEKTRRRSLQIAVFVGGGLILLFGLAYLLKDDNNSSGASPTVATTIDPTATTLDPNAPTTVAESTTTIDPAAPTTTTAPTTTVAEAFAYGTGPCPKADGSTKRPDPLTAPKLCIDPSKTYTAEVVTNKGKFTITLDPQRSPGNVNNFVTLADYGYYNGTGCHRVIKDFVVQCGRPGDDESAPGYTIPDELPSAGEYKEGMVVMANTGSPDSAGGQFFVITGENGATLPPQYSIIGTVTAGYKSTVQVLENLADPMAANGTPPLVEIDITSIKITVG
ncbi:MAG: peptidyl-prolyl cis-trans isomerase [Ilumatobacteraceae bacterium]|nr:peptidyl-prolyl cis-trans isomerase [Ilumatobacteraceae bacterium]